MFKNYLKLLLCFGVIVASWLASPDAMAQTIVWDGGGNDGKWSTATNWVGDVVPNGIATQVQFTDASATTPLFVTVDGNFQVSNLTIGNNVTLNLGDGSGTNETRFKVSGNIQMTSGAGGIGTYYNGSPGTTPPIGGFVYTSNAVLEFNGGTTSVQTISKAKAALTDPNGSITVPRVFINTTIPVGNGGVQFNNGPNTNVDLTLKGATDFATVLEFAGVGANGTFVNIEGSDLIFDPQNFFGAGSRPASDMYLKINGDLASVRGNGEMIVKGGQQLLLSPATGKSLFVQSDLYIRDFNAAATSADDGQLDLGENELYLNKDLYVSSSNEFALGKTARVHFDNATVDQKYTYLSNTGIPVTGVNNETVLKLFQLTHTKNRGDVTLNHNVAFAPGALATGHTSATVLLNFTTGTGDLILAADRSLSFQTTGFLTAQGVYNACGSIYGTAGVSNSYPENKISGAGLVKFESPSLAHDATVTHNSYGGNFTILTDVELNGGLDLTMLANPVVATFGGNLKFMTGASFVDPLYIRFEGATDQLVETVNYTYNTGKPEFESFKMAKSGGKVTLKNDKPLINDFSVANAARMNGLSFDQYCVLANPDVLTFTTGGNVANIYLDANGTDMRINSFVEFFTAGTGKIVGNATADQVSTVTPHQEDNAVELNDAKLVSGFTIEADVFVTVAASDLVTPSDAAKLTIGGDLVTNQINPFIHAATANDFYTAQLIFDGSHTATNTAQFITVTHAPQLVNLSNVKVSGTNGVKLFTTASIGGLTDANGFISALDVQTKLDLNGYQLEVGGLIPSTTGGGAAANNIAINPVLFVASQTTTSGIINTTTSPANLKVSSSTTGGVLNVVSNSNLELGRYIDLWFTTAMNMNDKDLTIHGNVFNSATFTSVFQYSGNGGDITFKDGLASANAYFSTVTGSVNVKTVSVQKFNDDVLVNNANGCLTSVNSGDAGLFITGFMTITGTSSTTEPALNLSATGVVSISEGSALTFTSDHGIIKVGNATTSFITGGTVFISGDTKLTSDAASDLVVTSDVHIMTGKTLEIGSNDISVGGDFTGGNLTSATTGSVRFIGGAFQTVAFTTLPNVIVDKCETGPFMTVYQADNLYVKNFTVNNGTYAMTTATNISGNLLVNAGTWGDGNGKSAFLTSFNTATSVMNFIKTSGSQSVTKTGGGKVNIPAVVFTTADVSLGASTGLNVYRGDATGAFTTVYEQTGAGNLLLNGNDLCFTGPGNIVAFQSVTQTDFATATGNIGNYSTIKGAGNVYIRPAVGSNALHFASAGGIGKFHIETANLTFNSAGGISLDNNELSLGGNLTNGSGFTTAFLSTGGLLNMTGANAQIIHASGAPNATAAADGIAIPRLKVNNITLAHGATALSGYVELFNGTQYAGPANNFATVLEVAGDLDLNNRDLRLTGNGLIKQAVGKTVKGGSINGILGALSTATGDANTGGIFISAFITAASDFVIADAGVHISNVAGLSVGSDTYGYHTMKIGGDLTSRDVSLTNTANYGLGAVVGPECTTAGVIEMTANAQSKATKINGLSKVPNLIISNPQTVSVSFFAGATEAAGGQFLTISGSGTTATAPKLNLKANLNTSGNVIVANTNGGALMADANMFITGTGVAVNSQDALYLVTAMAPCPNSMITVSTDFTVQGDVVTGDAVTVYLAGAATGTNLSVGGDFIVEGPLTFHNDGTAKYDQSSVKIISGTQTTAVIDNFGGIAAVLTNVDQINFPKLSIGDGSTLTTVTLGRNIQVDANGGSGDVFTQSKTILNLNEKFVTVTRVDAAGTIGQVSQSNGAWIQSTTTKSGIYVKENTNIGSDFYVDGHIAIQASKSFDFTAANQTLKAGGHLVSLTNANAIAGNIQTVSNTQPATIGGGLNGTVEMVTCTLGTMNFQTVGAISSMPRLKVNAGSQTVLVTESPISGVTNRRTTILTGNNDALTFTSGTILLYGPAETALGVNNQGVVLNLSSGNVNNAITTYQPMTTVGTVQFSGTTEQTITGSGTNVSTVKNAHNPDGLVSATLFPRIESTNATTVKLLGNIFLTASQNENDHLKLSAGKFDLNDKNIAFASAAYLFEQVGTGSVVINSAGGAAYNAKQEMGNLFFTATSVLPSTATGTNWNLGGSNVILNNGTGAAYKMNVTRRVGVGNGYETGVTSGIVQRYYLLEAFGNPTVHADTRMEIKWSTPEETILPPVEAAILTFQTADPSGIYTPGGVTSAGVGNFVIKENASGVNFATGYVTLGGTYINLTKVKDASEQNAALTAGQGQFRLTYPKVPAGVFVTATVRILPNTVKNADYGVDYFITVSGNATQPVVVGVDGSFMVNLNPNTTETFITVQPKDDKDLEGYEYITAQLTNETSDLYRLGNFTTAFMTVLDNDVPGFRVAVSGGTATESYGIAPPDFTAPTTIGTVETSELGATDFISVKLTHKPSANVIIKVMTSDITEGKLLSGDGTSVNLTFTSANWDTNQYVEVKGQDDFDFDPGKPGSLPYTLTASVVIAGTADEYADPVNKLMIDPALGFTKQAIAPVTINAANADDEEQIKLFYKSLAGGNVNENSPNGQLTIGAPTTQSLFVSADRNPGTKFITVQYSIAGTDAARARFDGTNVVSITGGNWNTWQEIKVAAVDNDQDDAPDVANFFVTATVTYPSLAANQVDPSMLTPVNFTATDDDMAGMFISAFADVNVHESGANGKNESTWFAFKLQTKPFFPVTVNVASLQATEVLVNGVSKTTVTIQPNDWNKFVTVNVKAVEDALRDGDKQVTIEVGSTESNDAKYKALATGLTYSSNVPALVTGDKITFVLTNVDSQNDDANSGESGSDVTPSKVSGLTAKVGSQSVVLTWAPNPEAGVTYEIYGFSLNSPLTLYGTTTATSFTITGLENGVTYLFRVRAVSSGSKAGGYSNDVNARPSIVLGTETENLSSQLNVFPNPTTGAFTIRLEDVRTSSMQIVLTDITGQQLLSNSYGSVSGEFQTKLVMENMPAGMYVLSVITDNGTYRTKVMLVNR